jgi:ABC-2 type transport system permease protein
VTVSASRVTWNVAARSLLLIPRLPSTFVPSLVMPLFFVIVFSFGFSGLANLPGFPAAEAIDFFLPLAAIMGASFAGVTTGMGIARDLEVGFYDRFLVSPVPRSALLTGALLAAGLRALLPLSLVMVAGLAFGVNFPAGPSAVWPLAVAALGMALSASAWSIGVALRFKTQQSAPLMQVAIFLSVFLSTAQMPLDLLTGWLETVASYNPVTYVLELARQGFLGSITWESTWPGLAAIGGMLVVLLVWAGRGMQKVIP